MNSKTEFYNREEKLEFLQTINEGSQDVYAHLFSSSKGTEALYKKDIYSFSLEQLGDVMRNINPTTHNSAQNTKSRLYKYINWAIKNGRRENNVNPLYEIPIEWGSSFIDTAQRYLSDSKLEMIVDNLKNAQDKALVQCIFEGIMGRSLSELVSMKYEGVDWDNNVISVKDSRTEQWRDIKVSDRCIEFIREAYKQQHYKSELVNRDFPLINYEGNIFKNVLWRRTENKLINTRVLASRLYTIKEKYDLFEFTALTINESGRIKMAVDLAREKGRLSRKDFSLIGDRFNLRKTTSNGYTYYNTSVMRHYINTENIKSLYSIDVEV